MKDKLVIIYNGPFLKAAHIRGGANHSHVSTELTDELKEAIFFGSLPLALSLVERLESWSTERGTGCHVEVRRVSEVTRTTTEYKI